MKAKLISEFAAKILKNHLLLSSRKQQIYEYNIHYISYQLLRYFQLLCLLENNLTKSARNFFPKIRYKKKFAELITEFEHIIME